MAETLPQPLTPADCDLRDFPFMPLQVARLRSSEQNSDVTPEANWAALLLWAASWHELPAASIPDNDTWQAKAAGYVSRGTVDPRWGDIRGGALRKFVKCSDGRLYHPIVAEQALVAWAEKLIQRWKSECSRIKKHNQRHELKGENAVSTPSYEAWIAAGRPTGHPLPVPGDKKPASRGRPAGQGVQGKGQGQGQGSKKNPSGSTGGAPPDDTPESARKSPNYRTKASKRVPADFVVTPELVQWAGEKAPLVNLERQTERFRDWQFRDAHKDWDAAWRNWMDRAQEKAEERRQREGLSGTGETAFQRNARERVAEATGGMVAAKPPGSPNKQEAIDVAPAPFALG